MPEPDSNSIIQYDDENAIVLTVDEHEKKFNTNHSTMNRCQLCVCNDVINSMENPDVEKDTMFIIDGPGGSGKTFLLEVNIYLN